MYDSCTLCFFVTRIPSTQYFISELKIPQNEICDRCLFKLENYLIMSHLSVRLDSLT